MFNTLLYNREYRLCFSNFTLQLTFEKKKNRIILFSRFPKESLFATGCHSFLLYHGFLPVWSWHWPSARLAGQGSRRMVARPGRNGGFHSHPEREIHSLSSTFEGLWNAILARFSCPGQHKKKNTGWSVSVFDAWRKFRMMSGVAVPDLRPPVEWWAAPNSGLLYRLFLPNALPVVTRDAICNWMATQDRSWQRTVQFRIGRTRKRLFLFFLFFFKLPLLSLRGLSGQVLALRVEKWSCRSYMGLNSAFFSSVLF